MEESFSLRGMLNITPHDTLILLVWLRLAPGKTHTNWYKVILVILPSEGKSSSK